MKRIIALSILFLASSHAFAGEAAKTPQVLLSPLDHPAAETVFVPPLETAQAPRPDPAWYIATGAKKGLQGKAETDEELSAAPDVAILARGFYEPWRAILAGLRQPAVLAGHGDIAGLAGTKPLLIIPSGALAGAGGSAFFRAGLAAYAGSGGTIFCMTQRSGADYAALPAPDGRPLTAAGWSEDSGPLYKASVVKTRHALLAQISPSVPALETDGYFISYPRGAQVLLARPDGYPTAIVYPFGKGWVVATALFSDFTSLLDGCAPDETGLLRGLLAWIGAAGQAPQTGGAGPAASGAVQAVSSPSAANPPAPARPDVRATMARSGDRLTVTLNIAPSPQLAGRNMIARAGSEEKYFLFANGANRISFDLPVAGGEQRIPYALYEGSGRALRRGFLDVPPAGGGVTLDRPSYLPGDKAVVSVSGLGPGQFTISGLGLFDNAILDEKGVMSFVVPDGLPSGVYPLHWELEAVGGGKKEGDLMVAVSGYGAAFEGATLAGTIGDGRTKTSAVLKIRASRRIAGSLQVALRSPDGAQAAVAEPVVSLAAGVQTVTVPLSFTADQAGQWELAYTLYVTLPPGPGMPAGPLALASGSTLFDAGAAAVLGIVTGKPLYYDAAGPVEATALIFGNGKADVELSLDGRRVVRETPRLSGLYRVRAELSQMQPGAHVIRASVSAGGLASAEERRFIYGLRLPDLTAEVGPPDFRGPVARVPVTVKNRGKSNAGSSRVALYEGDPARGGTLIAKADIPPLAPGGYSTVAIDWPVFRKAGARTLTAVADAENAVADADRSDNSASRNVTVPDLLLALAPDKASLSSGETLSYTASAVNLTSRTYKTLSLDAGLSGPAGTPAAPERTVLVGLGPGQERTVRLALKPALLPLPPGVYRLSATLGSGSALASGEAPVRVLPTLLLAGNFEGTAGRALLCKPFTVRYNVKSTGNVPPSSGSVSLEVAAGPGRPALTALTKQLPFAAGPRTYEIGKVAFPPGEYTLRLNANAEDRRSGISREFTLAEKPLVVAGPVAIEKSRAPFPRVLLWIGRPATDVEQALSNSLVEGAFDRQDIYFKVARSAADFTSQAMSGLFNTLVLLEPDEPLEKPGWLQQSLDRGTGLVIVGSGAAARSIAESLGFTFSKAPFASGGTMVALDANAGFGLAGSLPVSGEALVPQKKGAEPAGTYTNGNRPAILVDLARKGKTVVLPFSLSRSAFEAGTASLYSLLLRTAAFAAAPESEEAGGSVQIAARSLAGPVRAEVKEVLPPGSKALWTGAGGSVSGRTITFEFTAGREPKKLRYLYRPGGKAGARPTTEVFFDCGGAFESQGKME